MVYSMSNVKIFFSLIVFQNKVGHAKAMSRQRAALKNLSVSVQFTEQFNQIGTAGLK